MFNGLNWFGFETPNYSPHGLWSRSMDDVLDQVRAEGYNLIRLPFSSQMFDPASQANSIDYAKNPDLAGLTPIEIMDTLIEKAASAAFKSSWTGTVPIPAGNRRSGIPPLILNPAGSVTG